VSPRISKRAYIILALFVFCLENKFDCMFVSALERQRDIFLAGVGGARPRLPLDYATLEEKARGKLSEAAFAYIAGGAGGEDTLRRNSEDFGRWRIVPRMLRDVSACDMSVELFGRRLPAPVLLSPVGVLELAHIEADLAAARAAAELGIPFIFSNQASVPMEACAALMGESPRWFQLYWSKSNELVASLVRRADTCGCEAIVVTLDTTMLGWRPRDLRLAYLPFLRGKGIAQYTSDPVFQRLMDEPDEQNIAQAPRRRLSWQTIQSVYQLMTSMPGGLWHNLRTRRPMKAVRKFINLYTNPALNWEDLPFLRQHTRLPVLLKGILSAEDARRAVDMGINGIIVSNHGGRQVDGAISAIAALPAVARAVGGRVPVLLDSGVRGGADMFKALALGATAVCVGRPYVYGLALAGEAGVREVIANLAADFELTMRLAGCRSAAEIEPDCLSPDFSPELR
jgi:lactate 2-monooxygenase